MAKRRAPRTHEWIVELVDEDCTRVLLSDRTFGARGRVWRSPDGKRLYPMRFSSRGSAANFISSFGGGALNRVGKVVFKGATR